MTKLVILLAILNASVLSAPTVDFEDLLIKLPEGRIRGAIYNTPNNVKYYGWRGIPFAAPPVGNLRFEAPRPPLPWTGNFDATQDGNNCFNNMNSGLQSGDCLSINVYTPVLKPAKKLPVLFWIYGGAYQYGSAEKIEYGPDYFMEEDVILVSHNYRVGPMGFLSTGDTAIRGNAGLKDTLLALKWTKNNIALFGGDPEKITIFGESAGGQSVGLHLINRKSEGLYRAAIIQSGSVMTNSSAAFNPKKYALQMASLIPGGNYGNDSYKLADFLKSRRPEELIYAASLITGQDQYAWPTIEVEGNDAFLTKSPYVLYDSGNFNRVPAMMGICAEEGLEGEGIEPVKTLAKMFDADNKKLIPYNLRPNSNEEENVAAKIRSIYLQTGTTFSNNLTATVKFHSDNRFARALIKNAELHSRHAPVYVYQFAYATTPPIINGIESAIHGAELPYMFHSAMSPTPSSDATGLLVKKKLVKLWANFAKFLS